MSKQEDYLAKQMKIISPNLFFHRNYRPDFLKNDKTGKNLEIDFWFPHFKVGIEYQGAIHFNTIGRFKNNPDDSRVNDVLKQEILMSFYNNYSIIEFFENDLKGNIKLNIFNRIDKTIDYYNSNSRRYKPKIKSLNNFKRYLKYYTHTTPRLMMLEIVEKSKEKVDLLKDRYTHICPNCSKRIDMPQVIVYNYRKGYIHTHKCTYCNKEFDFTVKVKYKTFNNKING